MNKEQVFTAFKKVLEVSFGISVDVKLTDDINDDLDLDSLDQMELLMAMEDKVDCEISDSTFEKLGDAFTVDEFITLFVDK